MSEVDDPDREAPTPKVSGSLQRGPVFAGHAANVAKTLEDAAVRARTAAAHRRQIWTGKLDIRRAKELDEHARRLWQAATRLRGLSAQFSGWEGSDPGNDARLDLVMRLRSFESEATELLGIPIESDKV